MEITGTRTDNYRVRRRHSHTTIIVENWLQRESAAKGAGWALAPKSAKVRAMAIDVAAVAVRAVLAKY